MGISNQQYGNMLIELMDDGWEAEKAIMGADVAYTISENKSINFADGEVTLHRDFYGDDDDMELLQEVIKEAGKTAKKIAEMAKEAVEMRDYLSGNSLTNELAELRQKAMRALDRSEMTLDLLAEQAGGGVGVSDINERLDEIEDMVRGKGLTPQETVETEEEEPAERHFHPLDPMNRDNVHQLNTACSMLDNAVLSEGIPARYIS
jgi:archaellum component FlaC